MDRLIWSQPPKTPFLVLTDNLINNFTSGFFNFKDCLAEILLRDM